MKPVYDELRFPPFTVQSRPEGRVRSPTWGSRSSKPDRSEPPCPPPEDEVQKAKTAEEQGTLLAYGREQLAKVAGLVEPGQVTPIPRLPS